MLTVNPSGPSQKLDELGYERLEHANPLHAEYVVVNWCLGNTCNFACSYCPAGLHDGSIKWPSLETTQMFVDKVMDHFGSKKKFFFEFTGGEVTLYKDFHALAKHIKERGASVGIISNGSRSLDFWTRIRPLLDQVCLSFHAEGANAEHFLNVVSLMSESVRTHVNIMMHPEKFDYCYDLATKAKDIPNISMALQPLIVDFGETLFKYSEGQLALINNQFENVIRHIPKTHTFEYYRGAMSLVSDNGKRRNRSPQSFVANGTNTWTGWDCFAGLEQFVVDMGGSILRGWCRVGGVVGHIDDPALVLPTKPVSCDKAFCHCNFDIMTTKVKPVVSSS